MYKKANPKEIIWRWGKKAEKLVHLQQLCSEAHNLINLYGVTAFSNEINEKEEMPTVYVSELQEYGFEVYITPIKSTPEHRTITFPKPITQKTVDCWNKLWQKV
ncbi:hypothetical protein [Candidatus Uabimicrobium sp. HlEnr_7]|uniref:hypothetical protein n=1 Tax=Candidatus Uabimicrobium helgolandensis TaxID=3095367 RepID=UPI0035591C11